MVIICRNVELLKSGQLKIDGKYEIILDIFIFFEKLEILPLLPCQNTRASLFIAKNYKNIKLPTLQKNIL